MFLVLPCKQSPIVKIPSNIYMYIEDTQIRIPNTCTSKILNFSDNIFIIFRSLWLTFPGCRLRFVRQGHLTCWWPWPSDLWLLAGVMTLQPGLILGEFFLQNFWTCLPLLREQQGLINYYIKYKKHLQELLFVNFKNCYDQHITTVT